MSSAQSRISVLSAVGVFGLAVAVAAIVFNEPSSSQAVADVKPVAIISAPDTPDQLEPIEAPSPDSRALLQPCDPDCPYLIGYRCDDPYKTTQYWFPLGNTCNHQLCELFDPPNPNYYYVVKKIMCYTPDPCPGCTDPFCQGTVFYGDCFCVDLDEHNPQCDPGPDAWSDKFDDGEVIYTPCMGFCHEVCVAIMKEQSDCQEMIGTCDKCH